MVNGVPITPRGEGFRSAPPPRLVAPASPPSRFTPLATGPWTVWIATGTDLKSAEYHTEAEAMRAFQAAKASASASVVLDGFGRELVSDSWSILRSSSVTLPLYRTPSHQGQLLSSPSTSGQYPSLSLTNSQAALPSGKLILGQSTAPVSLASAATAALATIANSSSKVLLQPSREISAPRLTPSPARSHIVTDFDMKR